MSDARSIRLNERLKLLASLIYNLAAVLLTALAVRLFTEGLDLIAATWLTGEAVLIFLGWQILGLLESET